MVVALAPDAMVRIDAVNFAFVPHVATMPMNETIRLDVDNQDTSPHAFTFEAGSVTGALPPSRMTTFWLKVPTSGTFQFYCPLHSDRTSNGTWSGMVGTITVTPAS
jgi:plastocyanin